MLIEFTVGNFRSFKTPAIFSMVAANLTAQDKELDEGAVFTDGRKLRLLKSAAIYGANASGKSNFMKAFAFMKSFVLNSSKETQIGELIDVEMFRLGTIPENTPSSFEIVFIAEGKRFRYGFEVNSQRVVAEWLYIVPTTREKKLFERDNDCFDVPSDFVEAKGLTDKTRANALFLAVMAQFNGAIAKQIIGWFNSFNVISGLDDTSYRLYTVDRLEEARFKEDIIDFVARLDLDIKGFRVEESKIDAEKLLKGMPSALWKIMLSSDFTFMPSIRTLHHKYSEDGVPIGEEYFDIDKHESDGTQKLFLLAGPILDTLKNGRVLIIDEFDGRLHPLLTLAIVRLFNSKDSNPHNAQLVFTTHDTTLLSKDVFRRDQIWFAEKDRCESTHLFSLAEYRVRNDEAFEKNYVQGKYGAVPFICDLAASFEEVPND